MPRVFFTAHLRRHVKADTVDVDAPTVHDALERVFETEPKLRGYILDDRGAVRQHVMIFVNDRPLGDRESLSDTVDAKSEIHVLQALSGG
jgi:molybdopterin converting factor small subunit